MVHYTNTDNPVDFPKTKRYVHLVIEVTEDSTEVCGVYADNAFGKAVLHAEDLADYAGLERADYMNFEFAWANENGDLPLVYIETQEVMGND